MIVRQWLLTGRRGLGGRTTKTEVPLLVVRAVTEENQDSTIRSDLQTRCEPDAVALDGRLIQLHRRSRLEAYQQAGEGDGSRDTSGEPDPVVRLDVHPKVGGHSGQGFGITRRRYVSGTRCRRHVVRHPPPHLPLAIERERERLR